MVQIIEQRTGNIITFQTRAKLENFITSKGEKINTLERAFREKRIPLGKYRIINKSSCAENKIVHTAVLVSDIHFNYQNVHALDILYQILGDIKEQIDEYIDMGDGVNNNALSAFRDTETKQFTLAEELSSYKTHMEHIQENILAGEDIKYVVLNDNHFHLRKKRFLAEYPALKGLIPDLSNNFDEEVEHGKLYFPFENKRVGLIHGVCWNDFFTKAHLQRYGRYDVICGHTHTMQVYTSQSGTVNDPAMRSYGIPSMCNIMSYVDGQPTRQVNGFAVMTYDKDTENYNIEYVVVENGCAMFRGKLYRSEVEIDG